MNTAPIPSTDERVVSVAADGTPNPGVPTQVANPGRTTRRSILQTALGVVVGLASALLTAAIIAPDVLAALRDLLAPEVYAVLAAAVAAIVATSAALTRIMAIPLVDRWLQTHAPALAALRSN